MNDQTVAARVDGAARMMIARLSNAAGNLEMHELSIAMSIIDVAADEAERRRVGVVAVRLRLGPLSGVVASALQAAYERARERTPLENSRLVIEQTPILMQCVTCDRERPVVSIQELRCAVCAAPAVDIISGRELEIVGLEVIDAADAIGGSSPEGT